MTLADAMVHEWSKPHYRKVDPNKWLVNHIAQARKFVLDDGMSAFMADLSYVSLNAAATSAKRVELVEGLRKLARLPHATTWIEYNKKEHRRRVKQEYHPDIDNSPEAVPDRSGWLLMQHPSLETAFMAIHCTSHSWDSSGIRTAVPNTAHFAYCWSADESIPPWPRSELHRDQMAKIDDTDNLMPTTPAGILSGVLEYRTDRVSIIQAPHMDKYIARELAMAGRHHFNPLAELAHDMRYLWSLLATINDLPTSLAEIRPARGMAAIGKRKKFMEHTVITLTVPEKRYRTVAKRALAIARRRGHQVRGHWRKDRWHPGERIWIREHVRGDTSIGFNLHDYAVKHDTTA